MHRPLGRSVAAVAGLLTVAALTACSSKPVAPVPPAPTGSGPQVSGTPSLVSGPEVSASPALAAAPRYGWYLSVGDSLAFGYQEDRFQQQKAAGHADPTAYRTGYSDLVESALRHAVPGLVSQNLGCAAETTTTYAHGGCPAQPDLLHVAYAGPQADAASAFLHAQTGPGLVTVSLGANDGLEVLDACQPEYATSCVLPRLPSALTAIRSRLADELRSLAVPGATVVALQTYDPFVRITKSAGVAVGLLDGTIAAAASDAGVRTVDPRDAFAGSDPDAAVCRLTAMCQAHPDIHPTDEGYRVLAGLLLDAAGVPRG